MTPDPTPTDEEPANWFGYRQPGRGQVDAPEQRPDPTITDEELAEEEARHVHSSWGWCLSCERLWPCPAVRLIADLRASREAEERQSRMRSEDIARFRELMAEKDAEVERLATLAQSNRVEADAMGEIAREWEAEVDRLREDARENYARAKRAEQALIAVRAELAQVVAK